MSTTIESGIDHRAVSLHHVLTNSGKLPQLGAAEKLELRENVAYVQSIELRTNQAYRLVS